jgi:hypothetical protein
MGAKDLTKSWQVTWDSEGKAAWKVFGVILRGNFE